jgi:glyoxylate utilization-related uncharacterized protein
MCTHSFTSPGLDSAGKAIPMPLGGMAFQFQNFRCGMLKIAPEGNKAREETGDTEVFFVHRAAVNSVHVKINGKKFKFSSGDYFTVPKGNMYSIKNTSKTMELQLNFSLLSSS